MCQASITSSKYDKENDHSTSIIHNSLSKFIDFTSKSNTRFVWLNSNGVTIIFILFVISQNIVQCLTGKITFTPTTIRIKATYRFDLINSRALVSGEVSKTKIFFRAL